MSAPSGARPARPYVFRWAVSLVTAAGALVLAGASGFVNGTVDSTLAASASSAERVVYDGVDVLLWSGVAAAVVTVAVGAIAPRALSIAARIGLAAALALAILVAAAAVFLMAYSVGNAGFGHAVVG